MAILNFIRQYYANHQKGLQKLAIVAVAVAALPVSRYLFCRFTGHNSVEANSGKMKRAASSPLPYYLRKDQSLNDLGKPRSLALLCAWDWVKVLVTSLEARGLNELTQLEVREHSPFFLSSGKKTLPIPSNDPLYRLQVLARNEAVNVDGRIDMGPYKSAGLGDPSTVLSLKDLVRQTVIVSEAVTTAYGGYRTQRVSQQAKVVVCDQAALQFQQEWNSGRLVILAEEATTNIPKGVLDDEIFLQVVGEKKRSFEEVAEGKFPDKEKRSRYILVRSSTFKAPVYFDSFAYKKFVEKDAALAALAVNAYALTREIASVRFKFLKYGSGFFAGEFQPMVEEQILEGVLWGLSLFLEEVGSKNHIKEVELPFFENNRKQLVSEFEGKYSVKLYFTKEDALKAEGHEGTVIATTNCGDPHVVFGNEMGYSSVDAAIASNLKDAGKNFCPLLNTKFEVMDFHLQKGGGEISASAKF